jgi:putative ABC transport system permease protein
VSLLDRKLARDIVALRGQVISIALVVAAGLAVFVASVSTYNSLLSSRDQYYERARFPHVFVTLKRAPLSIVPRLSAIPGVAAVEPRIVRDVIVDWPDAPLPVSARMVSLSRAGDEGLAVLHVRRGSAPGLRDKRGVVVNEAFADANRVTPGTDIRVILNGRLQSFTIVGTALSPEYVNAVKPGLPIPDDRFFAILWADRSVVEAAFDMIGAFNDLAISLAAGAIERRDHASNRFLEDELSEQWVMAITIPVIFFGVAAFLLNVALGRQVAAQREQLAALKALGFPNAPLAVHYMKLVTVIVLLGSAMGLAGGFGFGHAMIASYRAFFRLPALAFELVPWSVLVGALICFTAASIGVLTAVHSVVRLTPAVAMRPAPPLPFRRMRLERLMSARLLLPSRLMALRNLAGRPVRMLLTTLGISFAIPIVVLGLFWRDAIDHMIDIQFNLVERGNAVVTFPRPLDRSIVGDLRKEHGVLAAEGQRIVHVRLRADHRSYLTSIIGLPPDSELRRPHDAAQRPIGIAPEGLTLTRRLAERLGVTAGQVVTVEAMEGKRRKRDVPVSAVVDEVIGMTGYMQIGPLNRMTGEGDVVSAVALFVEPSALTSLLARFKELPVIEAVAMKAYSLRSFLEKIGDLVFVMSGILTAFAVIIAVGIVYNSARIGLHERARELASLRVLGFTRAEVARIFFGEFTVEIAVAIPVGIALSQAIVDLIARFHPSESFQIPGVIGAHTFLAACAIVIAAAAASAYAVRRHIDSLDLVAVLKARD